MSKESIKSQGQTICDNLLSDNKGDYLTSKIVGEVEPIISEMSSLDGDIAKVQSAVNAKRAEIAARKRAEAEEAAKSSEN